MSIPKNNAVEANIVTCQKSFCVCGCGCSGCICHEVDAPCDECGCSSECVNCGAPLWTPGKFCGGCKQIEDEYSNIGREIWNSGLPVK